MHAGEVRAVGLVGLKAVVCFEVVTTIALVVDTLLVDATQPGVGIARTLTGLTGNWVTTMIAAVWENDIDRVRAQLRRCAALRSRGRRPRRSVCIQ